MNDNLHGQRRQNHISPQQHLRQPPGLHTYLRRQLPSSASAGSLSHRTQRRRRRHALTLWLYNRCQMALKHRDGVTREDNMWKQPKPDAPGCKVSMGSSSLLSSGEEKRGGRNSQSLLRLSSATLRSLPQLLETAVTWGHVSAAPDPLLTSFQTHFLHLRNPFFVRAKVG